MTDYTSEPLPFRVRKGLRYARLYGPRRTWAKVQSQYHMKRAYDSLPVLTGASERAHVGFIGCGNFSFSTIAYYLAKKHGKVIRAAMDVDIARAASLAERYGAAFYTDSSTELLEDEAIDLVIIASNHASHAGYAIEALRAGKHVHIEKPHVVNSAGLIDLCAAMRSAPGRVHLGFNRPASSFGIKIERALRSAPGPSMMSWFVAGHALPPDHWYLRPGEGGRIVGNLCHWTDFVLRMVPASHRFPVLIRPTRGERPDSNVAVTYTFADGSIGSITFSEKGAPYEGVKEHFSAQQGDVLISMEDFRTLTIERGATKKVTRSLFRDHGHERSIERSYGLRQGGEGDDVAYVWETGELFLKTREALEEDRDVVVEGFDASVWTDLAEGDPPR